MASEMKILESIVVNVSAPAISMMLYDTCSSDDQAGLLLGEIIRTRRMVRERNRDGVLVKVQAFKFHIQIKAVIVCPEMNLYKINFRSKNITKSRDILGWFTRRELITTNRINPLNLTFTEKLIHKNLMNLKIFKRWPFFTGCVLDTYNNASKNAHSFNIKFFQLDKDERFQEVEIENSISELKSYQPKLCISAPEQRQALIKSYKEQNYNKEHIDKSIEELAAADTNMFILLKEIKDISKDIKRLQQHKKIQKQPKNKNKPSWVTKLEEKHLYRNSKTPSSTLKCL